MNQITEHGICLWLLIWRRTYRRLPHVWERMPNFLLPSNEVKAWKVLTVHNAICNSLVNAVS